MIEAGIKLLCRIILENGSLRFLRKLPKLYLQKTQHPKTGYKTVNDVSDRFSWAQIMFRQESTVSSVQTTQLQAAQNFSSLILIYYHGGLAGELIFANKDSTRRINMKLTQKRA